MRPHYLVDKWSSEGVALQQHAGPELGVFATDQVARQALEKGVLVAHLTKTRQIGKCHLACTSHTETKRCFNPHVDQLLVTLAPLIGDAGQMGVSLFTVLADHAAVVVRVLSQETFRVIVAVDVDLCQSVMSGGFFTAFVDA